MTLLTTLLTTLPTTLPRSVPLAAAAALLALAPAMAADPVPLRGAHHGSHHVASGMAPYVALRGGFTRGDETTFGTALPGVDEIETSYDTNALVIGAVGVKRGGLRGELELSYARYGVDSHTAITRGAGSGTGGTSGTGGARTLFDEDESFGTASALSVMASAYYDLEMGRFSPFVGLGVGIGRLSAEAFGVDPLVGTVTDGVVLDDAGIGLAYHATIGTAFRMSDKVGLELGYRYQGIEAELDAVDGNETEVELTSHNVFAGVRIGF